MMNATKRRLIIFYATFFICFSFPAHIHPQAAQNHRDQTEPGEIVIESKSVEMNNALKMVTFMGDVNARKDDFVLDCDKMLIYYRSLPSGQKKESGSKNGIDKIVAIGNVIINRTKGGLATADEATYFQKDEKMILSGNPTVKQGDDLVKGDRITIFLKENRSIVESEKDKRVRVTITPRHPER